jgi:hypothetical protein
MKFKFLDFFSILDFKQLKTASLFKRLVDNGDES